MRILVVEDDSVLRDGLSRSLRNAGYAVETAEDGKLADQLLSVHAFDLVVLDLGLPGLDGLEVLRRLRRRPSTVPVLILTARDSTADRVNGLDDALAALRAPGGPHRVAWLDLLGPRPGRGVVTRAEHDEVVVAHAVGDGAAVPALDDACKPFALGGALEPDLPEPEDDQSSSRGRSPREELRPELSSHPREPARSMRSFMRGGGFP